MNIHWKFFGACLAQEAGNVLHTLGGFGHAFIRRLPLLILALLYVASGGFVIYHMALFLADVFVGPVVTPADVMFFGLLSSAIYAAVTTPLIILFGSAIETYRERVKQAQSQ